MIDSVRTNYLEQDSGFLLFRDSRRFIGKFNLMKGMSIYAYVSHVEANSTAASPPPRGAKDVTKRKKVVALPALGYVTRKGEKTTAWAEGGKTQHVSHFRPPQFAKKKYERDTPRFPP